MTSTSIPGFPSFATLSSFLHSTTSSHERAAVFTTAPAILPKHQNEDQTPIWIDVSGSGAWSLGGTAGRRDGSQGGTLTGGVPNGLNQHATGVD
ncbi:hypothetical protein E3U43_010104, partial [Larimichthys crocea]